MLTRTPITTRGCGTSRPERSRATLRGHTDVVEALAFSPDGKTLATGSADTSARLWDVASGQPKAIFRGRADTLSGTALSPDSKALAIGYGDGTARMWDMAPASSRQP